MQSVEQNAIERQANGRRRVWQLLKDYGIDDAKPETSLRECGLDSLEIVALVQDLEVMCQIDIPDEEAQKLRTVGDLIAVAGAA